MGHPLGEVPLYTEIMEGKFQKGVGEMNSYSCHAGERCAQRNISPTDIAFVMRFGHLLHTGGAVFVFLGRRDIPDDCLADQHLARLEGTTLVLSREDNSLITAYRNKKALRDIRRKVKWFAPARNAA